MAIHGLLPREVTPHMAGFELFEFHVGCNIGDAWVGVDLGAGNTPRYAQGVAGGILLWMEEILHQLIGSCPIIYPLVI